MSVVNGNEVRAVMCLLSTDEVRAVMCLSSTVMS